MFKKEKGFTLVELMIVVAIIGVLAAVAIPKFAQMLEKSREGATKGNLGAIKSAVSNYYADQQGNYPKTLDTLTWSSVINSVATSYPAFLPQYLDQIPPVKVTFQSTYATSGNGYAAYLGAGPGVSPNVGDGARAVTTGTWSSPAFPTNSTGMGWKYDNSTQGGSVWVNSELFDMSDNSYTTFGYQ
jgi:prepilin-type N-terminal cleavage/methylation domain-containing protein